MQSRRVANSDVNSNVIKLLTVLATLTYKCVSPRWKRNLIFLKDIYWFWQMHDQLFRWQRQETIKNNCDEKAKISWTKKITILNYNVYKKKVRTIPWVSTELSTTFRTRWTFSRSSCSMLMFLELVLTEWTLVIIVIQDQGHWTSSSKYIHRIGLITETRGSANKIRVVGKGSEKFQRFSVTQSSHPSEHLFDEC